MAPTKYIFNHFRKTGGTSLVAVGRQNLSPGEISPHLDDHLIRLKPAAYLEQYRLIAGHFSLATQMRFSPGRFRMTLLRDPIRRIFSAYSYFRTVTEQNVFAAKSRNLRFAEAVRYFRDSPVVIHNTYTYHFACIDKDCSGFPEDTATLLSTAKHNLAAFDFVGIFEEFDRSARALCRELGWRAPESMPHENRSWSEMSFDEIDGDTMQILRERNEQDYELYAYAVELFHRREAEANAAGSLPSTEPTECPGIVPLPVPVCPARRAAVTGISANWQHEDSKTLEISVRFLVNQLVPELTLGLLVTDSTGNIVWGINTGSDHLALEYETGEINCAAFLLACELPPGGYFITVALSEARRLGFHDHWIDRAETFEVPNRPVGFAPGVHFVQLRDYWSTVVRDSHGETFPWQRRASLAEKASTDGEPGVNPASPGNRLSQLPYAPGSQNVHPAFRPFGFFDVNAAIARPLVQLHLADERIEALSRDRWRLRVGVTNLGDEILSTRYEHPVKASYHWMSDENTVIVRDGLRSNLNSDVLPGDTCLVEFVVQTPPSEQCKLLCLTLVQEWVCWFDDRDSGNRLLLSVEGTSASLVCPSAQQLADPGHRIAYLPVRT